MSLIILTLFLLRLRRPIWITVVPMGFLLIMTTWAMVLNLLRFARDSETMLLVVGGAIFALELWLLFEAAVAVRGGTGPETEGKGCRIRGRAGGYRLNGRRDR